MAPTNSIQNRQPDARYTHSQVITTWNSWKKELQTLSCDEFKENFDRIRTRTKQLSSYTHDHEGLYKEYSNTNLRCIYNLIVKKKELSPGDIFPHIQSLFKEDQHGKGHQGMKREPSHQPDNGPARKQCKVEMDKQAALLKRVCELESQVAQIDHLKETVARLDSYHDRLDTLEQSTGSMQEILNELGGMGKKMDGLDKQLKGATAKLGKVDDLAKKVEKIDSQMPGTEKKQAKQTKADNQKTRLDKLDNRLTSVEKYQEKECHDTAWRANSHGDDLIGHGKRIEKLENDVNGLRKEMNTVHVDLATAIDVAGDGVTHDEVVTIVQDTMASAQSQSVPTLPIPDLLTQPENETSNAVASAPTQEVKLPAPEPLGQQENKPDNAVASVPPEAMLSPQSTAHVLLTTFGPEAFQKEDEHGDQLSELPKIQGTNVAARKRSSSTSSRSSDRLKGKPASIE